MDDITGQLNQILSDPNSMAQIQGIMSSLGLGGNTANSAPPTPAPVQNPVPNPVQNNPIGTSAIPDANFLEMLTKITPLLGQIKQEDSSTNLLYALRPMLSNTRQEKIDQAVRILQLMKLFPLLKDSGMLSSILGGLF